MQCKLVPKGDPLLRLVMLCSCQGHLKKWPGGRRFQGKLTCTAACDWFCEQISECYKKETEVFRSCLGAYGDLCEQATCVTVITLGRISVEASVYFKRTSRP
jgi:hypothetical protein